MTIHVKHMIQYIEQINHGIVSAIKSTDFTTALDLDASRQEYLNELKGFEGPSFRGTARSTRRRVT
jgi:hypothetical protein